MEIVFGIIILGLLAIIIYLLTKSNNSKNNINDSKFLNDISRRIDELKNETSTKSNELKDNLTSHLDKHRDSVAKQLASDFARSQRLIQDVTEKMTEFKETNKTILNATNELKNLQNILLNPKHRGSFGEFQLETALENSFPPDNWQKQYKFKDGSIVDAILYIKDKILPIDSKFSLENYNRMIAAKDNETKQNFSKKVRDDLKLRIDETAKYIKPNENTLEFAFMFIPSEALYYDLLTESIGTAGGNERDLIEYGFRDKKVIIVSPTTFAAYLQTVMQGLRALQIEKDAVEIQKRVIQLNSHLTKYNEYMSRLGNSLGTTVNHYNNAAKEFGKVDKDIAKIANSENSLKTSPLLEHPEEF